jgi:hypothetical protein
MAIPRKRNPFEDDDFEKLGSFINNDDDTSLPSLDFDNDSDKPSSSQTDFSFLEADEQPETSNKSSKSVKEDNFDFLDDDVDFSDNNDEDEDDEILEEDPQPVDNNRTTAPQETAQPVFTKEQLDEEVKKAREAALQANAKKAEEKKDFEEKVFKKNKDKDTKKNRRGRKSKIDNPNASAGKMDRRKKATIFKWFIIVSFILIIIIAVLNVLIPKKELTTSDVQQIAATQVGDTGFPLERGQGVATQFMQAYLMLGGDTSSSKLLDVFYNGKTSSNSTGSSTGGVSLGNASITGNVTQKIEYGPYVYSSKALTSKTGDYTIGALVYQVDTTTGAQIKDSDGNVVYKWLFFDVGVYYNEKTDSFLISKDSPNIVPEIKTTQQANAPDTKEPGDGQENKDLETTAMTQTLTDYIDAWASSKQSTLNTMTTPDRTSAALQGMNGLVTRSGELTYKMYGQSNNDGLYRALVTVNWKDNVSNQSSINYQSKYIIYVKPISDKKYLIKDIQPYQYYVSSDASVSGSSNE